MFLEEVRQKTHVNLGWASEVEKVFMTAMPSVQCYTQF